MSTLSVPNSFTPGANADAAQVNANYSAIVTYVNAQCIVKDASLAFTNVPSGPSSDPITANQLSRKQYVDNFHKKSVSANLGVSSASAAGTLLRGLTISDPGYDIDVNATALALTVPVTQADLSNLWQLEIWMGAVGSETERAALAIPIVAAAQSLCTPCPVQTFSTGTYGGTLNVQVKCSRRGGTQASLGIQGNTDIRFNYLEIVYGRHTP